MHDLIDWQPSTEPPPIAPGELHLWRLRADDTGDDLETCLAQLGERQRRRAQGMRHRGYRERYIRAQAGLRRVLGLYLGIPPQAVGFTYSPAGKPAVAQAIGALEFNLTTTADLALVAVSRGVEVGIDCEWVRPRRNLEAIARRMFSPELVHMLMVTPEEDRLECFYRGWTALEADAKADGRGLFHPRAPDARPPWVENFVPMENHVAAVARSSLPPRDLWITLDLIPLTPHGPEQPVGSHL